MGTPALYTFFLYSVPALSQTFLQKWLVTTIHFEASVGRVIQTSYTIYLTKQASSALFVGISLPEQWAPASEG